MIIDRTVLPIIYRKQSVKTSVFLIGVHIANITYSDVTKTFFLTFKNISDSVIDFDDLNEAKKEIEDCVVKFLEDVLDINQNETL